VSRRAEFWLEWGDVNNTPVIGPNLWVANLFGNPWVGFVLAMLILAFAAFIILYNRKKHYLPLSAALVGRLTATQIIADQETDAEAQDAFATSFDAIEEAMLSGGKGASGLKHAWIQFSETFVDKRQATIQATTRPEGYFLHLGDDTRVLAWWANIFVALGLTFTFLGIIGALSKAVQSMSGADMAHMQQALMALLTITAAKFWTSVAGVVASIVLRWFDRRWHSKALGRLEQLCDRLEYGTLFSPPQRVAAEQLRELKQQSVALTEFSHQLAASIGDALGQQMQPVVAGLSGIQSSLNEFKDGSFNQIGKELGDAISRNAGTEMEALAAALGGMTQGLAGVNDRLEGASGQASEQIATAAREFSTASEAMTKAFATLNGNIDAMAVRLSTQAEESEKRNVERLAEDRASYETIASGQRDVMRAIGEEMRAASTGATEEMVRAIQSAVRETMAESNTAIQGALEGFSGATAGIQSAFDHMRAQVAELGNSLSNGASEAASRNADVLQRAADALAGATANAQTGLDATLREAITKSAEASSVAISEAFASFSERFEQASTGLVQTLVSTSGRMETLAQSIERSTGAANDHAGKLTEAGREAQAVTTMLGRAANDVSTAATPIRDAATAIRESVGHSQELLRRSEENSNRQRDAMEAISGSIERTGSAATAAWEGYRDRFAGVDEALAKALDQIKSASGEHAIALNTQVGRIDTALAQAVDRLASALDDIKDLADALEDVRGRPLQPAE
jgi:HAMP domain-containing protein